MSTATLKKPDIKPDINSENENDHPKFFHYVKKNQIAESAVMGTIIEALCGERFPVTKSPKPDSPVCPKCKEIYSSLKPGR